MCLFLCCIIAPFFQLVFPADGIRNERGHSRYFLNMWPSGGLCHTWSRISTGPVGPGPYSNYGIVFRFVCIPMLHLYFPPNLGLFAIFYFLFYGIFENIARCIIFFNSSRRSVSTAGKHETLEVRSNLSLSPWLAAPCQPKKARGFFILYLHKNFHFFFTLFCRLTDSVPTPHGWYSILFLGVRRL